MYWDFNKMFITMFSFSNGNDLLIQKVFIHMNQVRCVLICVSFGSFFLQEI